MKQRRWISWARRLLLLLILVPSLSVNAEQATSYTYMNDAKGDLIRTQDAYLPEVTLTTLGLNAPEDLVISEDGKLYIADTGNSRIVIYDTVTKEVSKILEYEEFQSPRGLWLSSNGNLYVADSRAKMVFIFDPQLNLLQKITRPDTPSFGDTSFDPAKVAADLRGNIYVIGEGVYSGVIQLSKDGEFLGFFTSNVVQLSPLERMQSLLFTREQMERLLNRNPATFANIAIDQRGIVYTVTLGTEINPIKKHRTDGTNMFTSALKGAADISDIWVDERLNIYAASRSGYINVYTQEGDMIFQFGNSSANLDIAGLYTSLTAITVDSQGNIWTLDNIKGYIQSFRPTEYAQQIYSALEHYYAGFYDQAQEEWTEVLRLNQMAVIAHEGIGRTYMTQNEYSTALEHFKVAGSHRLYSEAFWELRNDFLQEYLGRIIGLILALYFAARICNEVNKRRKGHAKSKVTQLKENLVQTKAIRSIRYCFTVARHPFNAYYELRVGREGSIINSAILYIILFISLMLYMLYKGFIYQYSSVEDIDVGSLVLGFWAVVILFIFCNYLVTSINDGEGDFKKVFMSPAYAMLPAIIALLSVVVLSYALTTNEAFILDFVLIIGCVWSIILLFIGLETIHNYSFWETIRSIVFTIIFIVLIIVVILIISIMWDQVWQFLSTIGKEFVQNVLG